MSAGIVWMLLCFFPLHNGSSLPESILRHLLYQLLLSSDFSAVCYFHTREFGRLYSLCMSHICSIIWKLFFYLYVLYIHIGLNAPIVISLYFRISYMCYRLLLSSNTSAECCFLRSLVNCTCSMFLYGQLYMQFFFINIYICLWFFLYLICAIVPIRSIIIRFPFNLYIYFGFI